MSLVIHRARALWYSDHVQGVLQRSCNVQESTVPLQLGKRPVPVPRLFPMQSMLPYHLQQAVTPKPKVHLHLPALQETTQLQIIHLVENIHTTPVPPTTKATGTALQHAPKVRKAPARLFISSLTRFRRLPTSLGHNLIIVSAFASQSRTIALCVSFGVQATERTSGLQARVCFLRPAEVLTLGVNTVRTGKWSDATPFSRSSVVQTPIPSAQDEAGTRM